MSHTGSPSFLQVKFQNALPAEFVVQYPVHVVDITRQTRDATLSGREYNETSREAEIFLPKGEMIDLTRAYLEFDMRLGTVQAGPSYLRASNGIWTCVRKMEVREGDRLIQAVDHYNHLQSWLYTNGSTARNENLLGPMWGVGTQTLRNTWGAVTRNYALPISLHSITKSPINTHARVHKARLKLRLIFDDPTRWVETQANFTPTFTISNLRLVYEQVQNPPAFKAAISSLHSSKGIKTVFDDFMTFEQQFDTATVNLHLTPNKMALKSIFTVFFDDANRNNVAVNDKFETFEFLDITSYQHRFQDTFIQEKPVVCDKYLPIEPYQEYLKLMGHLHAPGEFGEVNKISIDNYQLGDKFTIALDLESAPRDPEFINNVSTHREGDVDIEIQLANPPPTRKVALTWVGYQGIWQHGGTHNSIVIS